MEAARPEGDWVAPQRVSRGSRPVVIGSGHLATCALACVVVGVGTAIASWWLIGNQSARTRTPEELDYAFRAPTVPHWVVLTLGPIALVAAAVALGTLVFAAAKGVIDRRWLQIVVALMIAGFLLAAFGRVATAGSIGANIGAGLALMLVPVAAILIVWAVFDALHISDDRTRQLDNATVTTVDL